MARAVLVHAFDAALRLLQPIVPFITDVLWRRLPSTGTERADFIARAAWPERDDRFGAEPEFELVREAINAIRHLRADYSIPPGNRITATLKTSATARDRDIFADEAGFIQRLTRCEIGEGDATGAAILLSSGSSIHVPLGGLIDLDKECRKAKDELSKLDNQLTALNARLSNPGFTDRAPAHVVEAERIKQGEWTARKGQLSEKVVSLCGS